MTHAALEGDWKRARDLHLKLFPICKAMFIETNPIPVKEAMAMLGMIRAEWRLPMCPMTEANREKLRQVLVQAGVLKSLSGRRAGPWSSWSSPARPDGWAGGSSPWPATPGTCAWRAPSSGPAIPASWARRRRGRRRGAPRACRSPPTRRPLLAAGRVLVEFTAPEPTLEHCGWPRPGARGAVVGTTGLQPAQVEEVRRLAGRVPILLSPNMSVGVNLAFRVLALMATALGDDYDVEITEIHHRMKKDAPSGTAAKMAEVIAEALGRRIEDAGVYGRHGLVGERTAKEIGVHALRGGDVVGEHTVVFSTVGERLELTHRAHSRDTFAHGALRAARFVATARPGLYSMHDVLGL